MDSKTIIIREGIFEIFGKKVEITEREINVANNNRAIRFFIRQVKKNGIK